MPTDPSATLLRMMQRWLSAFHEGRSIGSTDTLAVCHKHRDEHSVIPSGRAKGWPTALDHGALRARVREGRYWATMQDRVLEPGSSEWFVAAKKQREELGKKADAGMMQMTSFAEEQAG